MDKRPLGVIGGVFFLTILVLSKVGYEKSVILLPVILMAVFLIFLRQKKLKFFAVFASSVLCASIIFGVADINFRTNEQYFSGKNMFVEGVICERPYINDDKYKLHIETDKINGEDVNINIIVNSSRIPENTELYSKVKLKANLYKVTSYDDGVMRHYKADNICLTGSVLHNSIEVSENNDKPFLYHVLSFRYKLSDTIAELLPNDIGGFIAGITMGDKSLMSGSLVEKFRITGTSHILVVSGLHVAIWSGFVYWLLKKFLSRRISLIVSIIFLLFFVVFTGFTPSVIRASAMMTIVYLGIIWGEKPDSLNTLGIAALVLTAVAPLSVYNVGTVFSFASVFGILLMNEYVLPFVKEKLKGINNQFLRKLLFNSISLVLVSISAQLFTFPVSVLYDMKFSFLSVVSNFFISSLCTLAMVTGGAGTVILAFLPDYLAGNVSLGISIFTSKFILWVIDRLSQYDMFYRNVSTMENYILLFLLTLIIILLIFSSMKKRNKIAVFLSLLMPVILVSNYIPMLYKDNVVEFSVIDVGEGMCVTLTHNEEVVMLACSDEYGALKNITEHLSFRGVDEIKALYLPVNQSASLVAGAYTIKDYFHIEQIVTSAEYKLSQICKNSVSADYVQAEYFQGKVKIDYYTQKEASFALVRVGNKRFLINFYGSLKKENLPSSCINPDVYVTMYGNSYKTDFSATKEYVISCGYQMSYPITATKVHTTMNNSTYTKPILVQEKRNG